MKLSSDIAPAAQLYCPFGTVIFLADARSYIIFASKLREAHITRPKDEYNCEAQYHSPQANITERAPKKHETELKQTGNTPKMTNSTALYQGPSLFVICHISANNLFQVPYTASYSKRKFHGLISEMLFENRLTTLNIFFIVLISR